MPREKTPVAFSRTGFDRPAINPALDFLVGEPPPRDERERPAALSPATLGPDPEPPPSDRAPAPLAAADGGGLATSDAAEADDTAPVEPTAGPRPNTHRPSTHSREVEPDPLPDEQRARRPKVRVNMDVEDDVWDRFKDAVFALRITLGDGVTEALARHLEALEEANGGAFPRRPSERLRPGRRLQ